MFGEAQSAHRIEDRRFLRGEGRYLDDIAPSGCAAMVLLRSPHAHAEITALDVEAARGAPGVLAVLTGEDLARMGVKPIPCLAEIRNWKETPSFLPPRPVLAQGHVRYAGEPVVAIVAETAHEARDAAELVEIDYEILPVAATIDEALAAEAPLWREAPDNLCFDWSYGDASAVERLFASAARIVSIELENNRVAGLSLETRGAIGEYDRHDERFVLHVSSQGGHAIRRILCQNVLDIPEGRMRVITPDVGGGFGPKIFAYAEYALVLLAARQIGRPVKWVCERMESLQSDTQGRGQRTVAELALDGDGKFLAMRMDTFADVGAYPAQHGPNIATVAGNGLHPSVYRVEAVSVRVRGVFTNTVPIDSYRGAGRPEVIYAVERLVDAAARQTGIDPAELRRRNFIARTDMPYTTITGQTYDDGDFEGLLNRAIEVSGYGDREAFRQEARSRGKLGGVGLAYFLDRCGRGLDEYAELRFDPSGTATLFVGSQTNGQGHETAYAEVAARALGIERDALRVVQGDTDQVAFGRGTGGSRALAVGGNSVHLAAGKIVDWLGEDFDGVIIFDESHAMQNAAGSKGERGDQAASQQGRAGLRLQHALPDARVVYVSATGATTVHNLAYAQRLGLWGGEDFPFATRAEFVEAIEEGGVAAMEVLARDLKALGLYQARSLSYEGVEYELVEHQLTDEQCRIYDAYAGAFAIIHNNLDAAMRVTNVTGSEGTLNAQAKSAARSAFESAKQRFFNHLITAVKTPSLIASIEADLAAGHAAVVQIVSTGEALMERRLAEIPTEDWNDVQVDITPREYVLDYLAHSFPVQLYEPFTDSEGNLCSRPVFRDGQPVVSREAVARRDRLIEKLASLPPVPGALDQIVQRFGTDMVAEVTGRSRRIIRKGDRLVVKSRAVAANLAETSAFMDDAKRILVFSDAGGTGRSYHADLTAKNRRLRVHYLLEPGWKADAAIQGLGRTNRTNQAQPPLFRPVATDVKAEKRFLSTIARRLDTLGAITRGQRQTGGQGLFRAEDNLESAYARDALRRLYLLIVAGKVEGCPLQTFEESTGLKLTDANGIKDELPPITTFLNRLLALTIDLQNILFARFEQLLAARIEGAIASGTYDVGLETLRAERFTVLERQAIHTHAATGAVTTLLTIAQRERNRPVTLDEALDHLADPRACLLVNERSGRAAVRVPPA